MATTGFAMSLTLCGFASSNYFNKVKLALLEKGLPFAEEEVYSSQDEAFLELSPRGKLPYLRVGDRSLCESQAIVEYLEDAHPDTPLYPADPFERARCRELVQIVELHIELVARRLYGPALFGMPMPAGLAQAVAAEFAQGVAALQRRARFAPYLAGDRYTLADVAAAFHLPLAGLAMKAATGEDPLLAVPGLPEYLARLHERPHVAAVEARRREHVPGFIAAVRKRYGIA